MAALGIGGAGAFAVLAAWRPYALGATASLLGLGFYLTYRKPRTARDACGCERPRANRAGRVALWVATAVVLLVAASPRLLAAVSTEGQVRAVPGESLERGRLDAYVAAIDALGYEARAITVSPAP